MNKTTTRRIAVLLTLVAIAIGLRQLHVSASRPQTDANTTAEVLRTIDWQRESHTTQQHDPAVQKTAYQEVTESGDITWNSDPVQPAELEGESTQKLPAPVEAVVELEQRTAETAPVKTSEFESALIEQARASRMAFQSGSNVIPPTQEERGKPVNVTNSFSSSTLSGVSPLPKFEPIENTDKQVPTESEPSIDNGNFKPNPEYVVPAASQLESSPTLAADSKARDAAASSKDEFDKESSSDEPDLPSIAEEDPGSYPLTPREAKLTAPEPSILRQPKTAPKLKTKAKAGSGPTAALKAGDFLPAGQPKLGAHYKDDTPVTDRRAFVVDSEIRDFSPDPVDPYMPYDPGRQMKVYDGKTLNANQRPLIELGRPWYQLGQLPESSTIMGAHNPISPQFIIFGDSRLAYATTTQNGETNSQIASELNLFWNLQLTGTERFHMFMAPFDNGVKNTRYLLDEDRFDSEFDMDIDFGYFEGDLGAIVGGFVGETLPFDLPFAVGVMPLLVQNGVWMEDAFLGVAATIPARNSPRLNISNMDVTFFAGFDEIISDAFEGEDDAAKMWGVMSWIEATNGYWEIDYAFLEDRTARDRSYHNIGIGFTRRYGRFLSNSTRMIVNAGQSTAAGDNTADGVLLLSENSLITGVPSSIIPYLNMWAGFDRPQSAARAGGAGGVLRNTGILFESDGMTGFPTLDATAQDTFGAAAGINIMPNDWSQQLVLEAAFLGVMGNPVGRNAQDEQYGVGFRYQLPLTNATILRADGMMGFLRGQEDVHGMRMELRRKF